MKKYLFLLFLFIIYLILIINKKEVTSNVISYDERSGYISQMNIDFNVGINSKTLINDLQEYDDEYLINKVVVNNVSYDVRCTDIKNCYDDIYKLNDSAFYDNFISTGFLINNIVITSNKENMLYFFNLNNYNYTLKQF